MIGAGRGPCGRITNNPDMRERCSQSFDVCRRFTNPIQKAACEAALSDCVDNTLQGSSSWPITLPGGKTIQSLNPVFCFNVSRAIGEKTSADNTPQPTAPRVPAPPPAATPPTAQPSERPVTPTPLRAQSMPEAAQTPAQPAPSSGVRRIDNRTGLNFPFYFTGPIINALSRAGNYRDNPQFTLSSQNTQSTFTLTVTTLDGQKKAFCVKLPSDSLTRPSNIPWNAIKAGFLAQIDTTPMSAVLPPSNGGQAASIPEAHMQWIEERIDRLLESFPIPNEPVIEWMGRSRAPCIIAVRARRYISRDPQACAKVLEYHARKKTLIDDHNDESSRLRMEFYTRVRDARPGTRYKIRIAFSGNVIIDKTVDDPAIYGLHHRLIRMETETLTKLKTLANSFERETFPLFQRYDAGIGQ